MPLFFLKAAQATGLVLDGVSFHENHAAGVGGAVYFASTNAIADISSVKFHDNVADACGGISFDGCSVSMKSTTFDGNVATSFGGAFCSQGSDVLMERMTIKNNVAQMGGAVKCFSSNLTLSSGEYLSNNTDLTGGGTEWMCDRYFFFFVTHMLLTASTQFLQLCLH